MFVFTVMKQFYGKDLAGKEQVSGKAKNLPWILKTND